MKPLKKLLKPEFLSGYLQDALRATSLPVIVAVLDTDGEPLAMAGDLPGDRDAAHPFSRAALRLPLLVEGVEAGTLALEDVSGEDQGGVAGWGRFLASSLVEILKQHYLRRSLGDETLEQYREMALISRAVLHLNRSMRMRRMVAALLEECESSLGPQYCGLMYFYDRTHGRFRCCGSCGPLPEERLHHIQSSRLFQDVMRRGRGEVVNDLGGEERWDGDVSGISTLMIVPVQVSGESMGALVLAGTGGTGRVLRQAAQAHGHPCPPWRHRHGQRPAFRPDAQDSPGLDPSHGHGH